MISWGFVLNGLLNNGVRLSLINSIENQSPHNRMQTYFRYSQNKTPQTKSPTPYTSCGRSILRVDLEKDKVREQFLTTTEPASRKHLTEPLRKHTIVQKHRHKCTVSTTVRLH